MDIETFLDSYGLLAIFGIMLAKSSGVPIPIPADVVMLAASARVEAGKFPLAGAFGVLLVALTVGGVVQFVLVRGLGRGIIYRYGRYLGLTPARLDSATKRLKHGGITRIGLAILTPGVRSVAVIACGLAGIPMQRFASGLTTGSSAFLALHFVLGHIGGSLLSSLGTVIAPPALIGGLLGLLAVGFGLWYIIRRRQMPQASTREVLAAAAGAWHEATCPACLALGAINKLQLHTFVEIKHVHAH
ncbi:MAG: VTT domain-containing protein [Anaerolineae bacterium]